MHDRAFEPRNTEVKLDFQNRLVASKKFVHELVGEGLDGLYSDATVVSKETSVDLHCDSKFHLEEFPLGDLDPAHHLAHHSL